MKRLPLVILLFVVVLVAMVTGCGDAARYDGRLVAVDSLMHDYPDSALTMVEALSDTALAAEGDRAYRDLLLTQARYKAYVTATSDSDINRALAYYLRHSREREKLTRAYLYKGAVMEELGHPDSAMLYYKHAEATADEKDYVNLGQINTRIASLYRLYYGNAQTCFDKYNTALGYYILLGDKGKQLNCLYNMVMCDGIVRDENQDKYYKQAITLAMELQDNNTLCRLQELKCRRLCQSGSEREEAKRIAINCLSNYGDDASCDLLLDLSYLYIIEGKPDSSRYFLRLTDERTTPECKSHVMIRKFEILSKILKSEGDVSRASLYLEESRRLSDSILNCTQKYTLEKTEKSFNDQKTKHIILSNNRLKWVIGGVSLLFALLLSLLYFRHKYRINRLKASLKELDTVDLNDHSSLLERLDDKDGIIEEFVSNMVILIQTCINSGTRNPSSELANRIETTVTRAASDDFWNGLRQSLDKTYGGLITRLSAIQGIKEKDLRFIELTCCGFSYIEIAIVMGYSTRYISNKRTTICKKLGINEPLKDYLNRLMQEASAG